MFVMNKRHLVFEEQNTVRALIEHSCDLLWPSLSLCLPVAGGWKQALKKKTTSSA